MANIKSSAKKARVIARRTVRNRFYRSTARTRVKQARLEIMQGEDKEQQLEAVREAIAALDRAAVRGVIHKNNAARRKSRLMRLYHKMAEEEARA